MRALTVMRPLSRAFGRLARRRRLAVVAMGLVAAGGSAVLSGFYRPQPHVHDEFSYLLAADTFAHGRLTNPSHPLWQHFETFHVLQQPTYASKFPPAQGLVLALGQVLTGRPLVGVWLSVGLACAAILWMLQAWLPARWALLGALLATLRLGLLGDYLGPAYWGQSYWGGAVAALGGALAFGALRRIATRPLASTSLLLGLGLVLMANSRPFEGLVVSLPIAGLLLLRLRGPDPIPARVFLRRVALPLLVVLTPATAWMAYYNFRVTGDPLVMPYFVHDAAYGSVPHFLFFERGPEPVYRHDVIRRFHDEWELPTYLRQRASWTSFLNETGRKADALYRFYLGALLAAPLLALPWAMGRAWTRFAALVSGLLLAAFLPATWVLPHYAAPITGPLFVLVVEGLRRLRVIRFRGWPAGRFAFLAVLALCLLAAGHRLLKTATDPALAEPHWGRQRARILARLQRLPERHLVVVRYGEGHNTHEEWVYNEADIDDARVVWAREMADNDRLAAHFNDRRHWLLMADESPPRLVPMTEAGTVQAR